MREILSHEMFSSLTMKNYRRHLKVIKLELKFKADSKKVFNILLTFRGPLTVFEGLKECGWIFKQEATISEGVVSAFKKNLTASRRMARF